MTDYKKYSLKQLENFLYDAMSTESSPQEIYDVIKGVVEDNYYTYKKCASEAYELLALLNGNGKEHLTCDKDDTSSECKQSWNDFWEEPSMPPWGHSDMEALQYTDEELDAMCSVAEEEELISKGYFKEDGFWKKPKDKVVKWILPVEEDGDDCVITFPEDLLEQTGWKEGDTLQWIDQGDGSFKMIKTEN